MKKSWKYLLVSVFLVLVLPGLLFSMFYGALWKDRSLQLPTDKPSVEPDDGLEKYYITLKNGGSINKMELNEYVTGVVLREMPADFEEEALKAQAVVARTYTLRRQLLQDKHETADVCTEPSCCQGFLSEGEFLRSGGSMTQLEKVKKAVYATGNQVLLYDNELIEATYFSCSGGKTEDAQAVWGSQIAYLQSVESPGEENAAHYTDTQSFYLHEFASALGVPQSDSSNNWISNISYTEGGGVESLQVGNVVFRGTAFRQLLGLRSTAFVITTLGNTVTITTKGFGHRVGMSQYGADAMAAQGSDYRQILQHYYQGIILKDYP